MSSPDERIRFLTSSENRVRLLSAIEDEPARPSTLAEELPMSRSAIQRNLRSFVERGWAARGDGGYRCTFDGRLILHRYRELADTVRLTEKYGRFLDALADAGLALTADDLESVTITAATPHDPHAALHWYTDRIAELDVTTFRGIAPVVSPVLNDAHQGLLSAADEVELVLDEAALSTSRESYSEAFADALEHETLSLYVHPESLSFGLSLFDDHAFIGVYDDSGQSVACFEGDSERFLARVVDVYETYRADARPIEAFDVQ
jgi:predicted transcriptional regulator